MSGNMDEIAIKRGSEEKIIAEIETYIREGGGEYDDWYVGLTDNPMEPVKKALLLKKVQGERLAYIETSSPQIALAVADYFINLCGTDGNLIKKEITPGCNSIYVYKKAAQLIC